MYKVERGGEVPAEKREDLGQKLRRSREKAGQQTPVASFGRLQEFGLLPSVGKSIQDCGSQREYHTDALVPAPRVSARKLAAALREFHHYKLLLAKMHHRGGGRLRRLNHGQQPDYEDKGVREAGSDQRLDPSPSSPDLLGSSSSLRQHVAATLVQQHRASERGTHDIQPLSSGRGSSMEIAPYNLAATPTSSIELKAQTGYSLRTSAELLKVLNRIWTLEEQHVSNTSLVKALKKELGLARSPIKSLVHEQQASRHAMDELLKQLTLDKLSHKDKERDRVNTAVQSLRNELENEKNMRKRSETLHRKLARELHEVKTNLQGERRALGILESLCDEFALGILDYEKELHALRKKTHGDWVARADCDHLILHLSESWLDERIEAKTQTGGDNSIVEKLGPEIEAFLVAKKRKDGGSTGLTKALRRSSLESMPLNAAVSAPNEDDEDSSMNGDSNCSEFDKTSEHQNVLGKKKTDPAMWAKGLSPSDPLVKFEVPMAHCDGVESGSAGPILQVGSEVSSSSLKSKLFEARAKGQHRSRSSSKASVASRK